MSSFISYFVFRICMLDGYSDDMDSSGNYGHSANIQSRNA